VLLFATALPSATCLQPKHRTVEHSDTYGESAHSIIEFTVHNSIIF